MEREIRYAITSDNVRIAYAESGDGPTMVQVPNLFLSSIHTENLPSRKHFADLLAARFRYVRFDHRGTGMSQRDVGDLSPDRWLNDMDAVIDKLNGPIVVFGYLSGILTALLYALKRPERVTHLLLWPPPEIDPNSAENRALAQVAAANWELFTENFTHQAMGWGAGDEAHQFAGIMREVVSRDTFFRYWGASRRYFRGADLYDQLMDDVGGIGVPTMVMQRRGGADDPLLGQLAARIPDARLKIFDGDAAVPTVGDLAPVVDAMAAFCGARDLTVAATAPTGPRFMTILFTDVVDHAAMMQRLGDEPARAVMREHEAITRDALARHGGSEVKTGGDGFMASFESVTAATRCAIDLQRAFARRNATAAEPILIRSGLNAGEPIAEDGDYFGSSVNLAARVAAQAGPAEILIPEPVRHLLAGKDFRFENRGEVQLKGFTDTTRLYSVLWR